MTCLARVGGAQRAVFCSVYCSQAAASATLKVPQIYTPGELVEHTTSMRLRQIWKSRLSSSLFVDASSTTTQPRSGTSAAPPPRANSMTSVTSSLAVLADLPLYPQYSYSRQASDSLPASTKPSSHAPRVINQDHSNNVGRSGRYSSTPSLCTSLSTPPMIKHRGVPHTDDTRT